ncbi:MAG: hypothetical protein RIC30_04535 [Marinoscillum sp.]|uniref:hypothetical protein n=1 Tax=Marinoscillum sp. TaxID=2024838 RepID=UPI00330194BB
MQLIFLLLIALWQDCIHEEIINTRLQNLSEQQLVYLHTIPTDSIDPHYQEILLKDSLVSRWVSLPGFSSDWIHRFSQDQIFSNERTKTMALDGFIPEEQIVKSRCSSYSNQMILELGTPIISLSREFAVLYEQSYSCDGRSGSSQINVYYKTNQWELVAIVPLSVH